MTYLGFGLKRVIVVSPGGTKVRIVVLRSRELDPCRQCRLVYSRKCRLERACIRIDLPQRARNQHASRLSQKRNNRGTLS